MENTVKEIVNLGIGLYRVGEESVQVSLTNAGSFFNEIKFKGETNNSEQANQLRELLGKAIRDLSEIENNAKTSYEELSANLSAKYNEIANQIDGSIPESLKENIQAAIEQVKSLLDSLQTPESNTVPTSDDQPQVETPAKKGKTKVKAA